MLLSLFRLAGLVGRVLIVLCCAMLVVMTGIIVTLVFTRYILSYSFPWAEELTRYLLIWLVMLAAAVNQYRNDNIRVDFVVIYLPPRLRAIISLIHRVLIIGFALVLLRYGMSAAIGMGITGSPSLGFSMTIPYLAIPVGAGLLAALSILNLIDDLRELTGRPRLQTDAVEA